MNKLSLFLEGVISAMILLPNTTLAEIRYIRPTNMELKPSGIAQDWQAVGVDVSNASKKVGNQLGMVRYESKTA